MNEAQRVNKSIARKKTEPLEQWSIGYALNWAWRIQGLPANLKLSLVALASHCAVNGTYSDPVRWIADHYGCNVRHMQKMLVKLRELGLVRFMDLNPGTVDRSRLFTLELAIDPDLWSPESTKVPLMRHPGLMLNTRVFHERLEAAVSSSPKLSALYRTYLSGIYLLGVFAPKGPNARLKIRIPHKQVLPYLYGDCKAVFLETASELAGVSIKKFQLVNPQSGR